MMFFDLKLLEREWSAPTNNIFATLFKFKLLKIKLASF
jgi:hypothetical protein